MESSYIQGIQRKINEIAKDYKSKGYEVILEPNDSRIPNFIRNFQPDLIALSEGDKVVVKVKSSDSKTDFKSLENLANLVNSREHWRFELVFTNPKDRLNIEAELILIDISKIKSRVGECESLIKNNSYDSAFLLGWSTLEAAIRIKLANINVKGIDVKKPPLHLIKNLFSYGIINQSLLRKIEFLNQLRNKLIHGFEVQIDKDFVIDLLEIINKLSGQNNSSEISEWISWLDLDGYEEIYALYQSVAYVEQYGLFTTYEKNGKFYVKSDVQDEVFELNGIEQKKAMLKIIEDDYMDGMDSEGFYGLYRSMEKDD